LLSQTAIVVVINTPRVLLAQLGPIEGSHVLKRCLTRLKREFEAHQGKITDDSGWTISALFQDAEKAIQAARATCQRIEQLPPVSGKRLTVSIAVAHTLESAFALAEKLPPGTVSVSSELESSLAVPAASSASDDLDEPEPEEAYPPTFDRTIAGGTLVLSYREKTLMVDDLRREASIGRSSECTLPVNGAWVSRVHVTIVKEGNCFAVIDSSTNGTYIYAEGQPEKRLHRQVHFLEKRGAISIGQTLGKSGGTVVQFEIRY